MRAEIIEWVNKETGLSALYYWLGNGGCGLYGSFFVLSDKTLTAKR